MLSIKALIISVILVVPLSGTILAADDPIEPIEIGVMVSPNVLALNSNGGSVSLHANINYYSVSLAETALTVNGEPLKIYYQFADDRGDLVVKCSIGELKNMVEEDSEAVFVLTVYTKIGGEYEGTDTIRIASPQGK